MSDLEINQHSTGFLKNAEYRMHVTTLLQEYKNAFGAATSLKVNLDELPLQQLAKPPKSDVTISEDGKEIVVQYYNWRFYNKNGQPGSLPLPSSVFESLRYLLGRAVKEYAVIGIHNCRIFRNQEYNVFGNKEYIGFGNKGAEKMATRNAEICRINIPGNGINPLFIKAYGLS